MFVDVICVYGQLLTVVVCCMEGNFFHQALKHGVQPAGSDILGRLIHMECNFSYALNALFGKVNLLAFRVQKRMVLRRQ